MKYIRKFYHCLLCGKRTKNSALKHCPECYHRNRNARIMTLYLNGIPAKEIAKDVNLTPSRIYQIRDKIRRMMRHPRWSDSLMKQAIAKAEENYKKQPPL